MFSPKKKKKKTPIQKVR